MDEIIKEFLQESGENLDRLDQDFVRLESDPTNAELLGSIFRTIHTVKGTCGFLGFTKLEKIAHAGENLLSLLRAGELNFTEEIADALLEMTDAIRAILKEIQESEAEGNEEYSELIHWLKDLQTESLPKKTVLDTPADAKAVTPASPTQSVEPGNSNLTSAEPATSEQPATEATAKKKGAKAKSGPVRDRDTSETLAEKKQPDAAEAVIRVDVNLLEKQMNLVSELVLLRNRLLQIAAQTNERNLNLAVHGLNSVTSELRKNVMKTRMQPVSQLFDKLSRIVRDVSKDLGKKVKLETKGGDTELDKSLLEAIKDPVTHILRNSIDHGVEAPDRRVQLGKPAEGTVRIRAFHEGGNFQLEIADDGAGIDGERVKQKALSKGLVTSSQISGMTQSEILNLIFLPGLSTAEKVTNVSGRGVGMDVVKTNIERIGGKAKLASVKGQGTTLSLEIPLTLATIPALTVMSGKSVFAVPQAALVEMIAVDSEESYKHIETIDGISVLRFRGTVIPLLSLRRELKLDHGYSADTDILKLVVVRTEGRQFALQVDAIRNTEEIVIKPLDKRFKTLGLYSGAAVMGDGRVSLILDIPAFARRAGVATSRDVCADQTAGTRKSELVSLLLLGGSDGEHIAVPLESVQRLEEFDVSAKETSCGLDVMQYRNEILRVVRLEDMLEERRTVRRNPVETDLPANRGKLLAIVVRSENSKNVILEVSKIFGIAKVEVEKLSPPSRHGVRGSLVVQEKITELLDMESLLAMIRKDEIAAGVLVGAGSEQLNGS